MGLGTALRLLYEHFCKPVDSGGGGGGGWDSHPAGPYGGGVHTTNLGLSALARDLFQFENTSQVPEGLSKHVASSKKAQANWYRKLAEAWREAQPPPKTPEEASKLVIQTLKGHLKVDVGGFLAYYGLPPAQVLTVISSGTQTSLPKGAKFELNTLPIDAKAISDGDTLTVYVSTEEAKESVCVPQDVHAAAVQRAKARARKDYSTADAFHKQIIDSGYRVISLGNNEEVLARKYRIRLRGIDTPESKMPYGKEAKEALAKLVQGKCLKVFVYEQDRYGRCVGDVYFNQTFVQEVMLKKGFAWHYKAYDQRPELAKWETAARAKRIGLWASSNPDKPWEWRKNKRDSQAI